MESEKTGQNRNDTTFNFKRQNEEVLEISSTGYGLESISKENEEKELLEPKNPSCGGL
ncbi:hypothetical protein ACSU64_21505 [Bacillaceae bacterium C204]|uniref:hypothetical protein n=1 Tax=Neobacillus sp. 204 TaxID=3383351 RepID=UPI0039785F96